MEAANPNLNQSHKTLSPRAGFPLNALSKNQASVPTHTIIDNKRDGAIVFINPGPSMGVHTSWYYEQYADISKYYTGYILTTSYEKETVVLDRFTYISTHIRSGFWGKLNFLFFCIWNALKMLYRKERIKIVSTYDPLFTGIIGVCLARILGAKLCIEVNGVYTSRAQLQDITGKLRAKIKRVLYQIATQLTLRNADGIRLLFSDQITWFDNSVKNKIIKTFPCYVPVKRFTFIREDKEILFVGFPFKLKGVDILIQAFKSIAHKYPDWKLKILGWYPNATELKNAIDYHKQIYHHPPVSYIEMPNHIGSCAILVLPSRSEAMGRVLVEAMAAGKPVIGSNVDGIPTVIDDGLNGFLFESENIYDLANKLTILMDDQSLRQRFGAAGRMRANMQFGEQVYLENIVSFYSSVLEA